MNTERPKTQKEAIELLEARIDASGLSTSKFAERVLLRDGRTVRRWLSGESPIPNIVMEWLIDPPVAPWPREVDGNRS